MTGCFSRARPEDDESEAEAESSEGELDFDPIAALKNVFFGKCGPANYCVLIVVAALNHRT